MTSSQITVADARAELSWIVDKDNAFNPKFLRHLNEACQQIINSGKWPGTVMEVVFPAVTDGFITLPPFLTSILGVTVNNVPRVTFSQYYPYALTGPNSLSKTKPHHGVLVDAGDHYVTSVDHLPGERLRFTLGNAGDIGQTIRIYGTDVNDNILIDNEGVEGIELELSSGTVTTSAAINKFTGLQKPPFLGRLTVSSWDNVATATQLQVYEPYETRPRYKRYIVGASVNEARIGCLCKVRYIPKTSETDFIIPGNLSALGLALQAVDLQHVRNYQEANIAWGMCYSILEREWKATKGSALPNLNIISAFTDSTIKVT